MQDRLELTLRDIEDHHAVATRIGAVEARIQTLLRIFDALLRLGEVETAGRRAGFEQLDFASIVRDLAESLSPVFAEATKELAVRIEEEVNVRADEALLVQMTPNLLENVVEHARDGARAWTALSSNRGPPQLEIGDDGPGIPRPHRDRIFERFYRADPGRSTPGKGLELSLVKTIADLREVSVDIASDTSGAVFVLSFPKHDDSSDLL